jgi:hypothetical protein
MTVPKPVATASAWVDLRKRTTPSADRGGWIRRRMTPESNVRVHLAVRADSLSPCLMIDVPRTLITGLRELPSTNGLAVTVQSLEDLPPDQRSLVVELTDPEAEDLFAVFCGDLASRLVACDRPQDAVAVLLERLHRWQSFLSAAVEGLGRSAAIGLFGELIFMRDELVARVGIGVVMNWTGAQRQPQDFVIPGLLAAEVKTTASAKLQKVRINGENQLDASGLSGLFLVCLRLEEAPSAAESLNEVVASLRALTNASTDLRAFLDARLAEAGYLDRHADRYASPSWRIAECRAFEIGKGFPSVTTALLPAGVSDLSYQLDLAHCITFERTTVEFRARLDMLCLG